MMEDVPMTTTFELDELWAVLEGVLDPEVPVLSVVDLGIVRDIDVDGSGVVVTVTPTYSGCPSSRSWFSAFPSSVAPTGSAFAVTITPLAGSWTWGM